jgi:hypothetical protein
MHERLDELALHTGAAIYDPAAAFCHDGTCPTFAESGVPLYFDDVHLRESVIESGPFSRLDEAILAAAQK